jgi:hypothetical protein
MSVLAAVRPDSWNLPLLIHVVGAMLIVAVLVTVAALLLASRRGDGAALSRVGFRVLLWAGIPSFLMMRVGAELIAAEADVSDESAWIGIGYITSDLGLLLIIVSTVCAGIGARRLARAGGGERVTAVAAWLTLAVLAAFVVAIWAMTTKPA